MLPVDIQRLASVHSIAQACVELYLHGGPLEECLAEGIRAAREVQTDLHTRYGVGMFHDVNPAATTPLADRFVKEIYRLIELEKEAVAKSRRSGLPEIRLVT